MESTTVGCPRILAFIFIMKMIMANLYLNGIELKIVAGNKHLGMLCASVTKFLHLGGPLKRYISLFI